MFLWPLHIWLLLPLSLNISLSLSRSLYLSLTHSLTHSLPHALFCTVSLQSLPSKKEAVGGSLPPPHMNQYKALLRKNISLVQPSIPIKQKRKKGRRKERKKRLVREGTRNSPYCKRAVSWQEQWLGRDRQQRRWRVSIKEMEMAHVEPTFAMSCLHVLKSLTKIVKSGQLESSADWYMYIAS